MGTYYARCEGRGLKACPGCLRNVDNPPAPDAHRPPFMPDVHGEQCRSWKATHAEVRPAMRAPVRRVNGSDVL